MGITCCPRKTDQLVQMQVPKEIIQPILAQCCGLSCFALKPVSTYSASLSGKPIKILDFVCHLSTPNIRCSGLNFGPSSQDLLHLIWKMAQIFVLTQIRKAFYITAYWWIQVEFTVKVSLKPSSPKQQPIKTKDHTLFLKGSLTYFICCAFSFAI